MPMVQYSHPQRGINVTKPMQTPVNVTHVDHWFKQAVKTIPEIPKKWYRDARVVTESTIIFELMDTNTGERCAIVIARRT